MLNKSLLIGRLVRDPETKTLANGTAVSSFTLAVDRDFKNANGQKECDFIPIVAWRKTAELCGKYLTKGSQIAVEGRIQTRSYDTADGTKRYVTEVIADQVHFVGGKSESQNHLDGAKEVYDGFEEIPDEDVPF